MGNNQKLIIYTCDLSLYKLIQNIVSYGKYGVSKILVKMK